MEKQSKNPFSMIFSGNEPKIQQTACAVALLREMLDKPENPRLINLWAQTLIPFSGDQLAAAFNTVALTCKGWPTLGDITEPILEAEYAADLAWLLLGLKRHKKAWQDRDPIYGPDIRVRNDAEHHFDFVRGEMLEDAIPAPPIPPRLVHALQVMGSGTVLDGLAELSRHPMTGAFSWDAAEAGKVKFQTERDFRNAWTIARRRELAGQ